MSLVYSSITKQVSFPLNLNEKGTSELSKAIKDNSITNKIYIINI